MGCQLDHIHLLSEDLEAAAGFYQTHFGATLCTPLGPHGDVPGISVALDGVEIRIRGHRPTDPEGPGNALHHIGIRVDDLDVFSAGLERAGVEFTKKPGPGAVGIRTSFIKAPDGVLIELADESPG
jgi:lactoylglutathione lyase